jgi:hypothetical protein
VIGIWYMLRELDSALKRANKVAVLTMVDTLAQGLAIAWRRRTASPGGRVVSCCPERREEASALLALMQKIGHRGPRVRSTCRQCEAAAEGSQCEETGIHAAE